MKALKNVILAGSLLITCVAFAQETETRKVSPFTRLEVGGSFDVVLQKGSETSVKISAENVDTKKVITENQSNTLKVYLEKGNYRNMRLKVYITYTSLDGIDKSGSGNLSCESDISSSDFSLSSSGSGNIVMNGNIKTQKASINRSGSGNMKLDGLQSENIAMNFSGSGNFDVNSGSAKTQTIRLSGSGNVSAYGLKTETCAVAVSGSGDIEVSVNDSLEAQIVGSGNIQYKGNAQVKKLEIHGSGKVDKRG